MIGALFTYLFYSLFRDGTKIVVITLIVIGTILLFNTSLIDLFKKIKRHTYLQSFFATL